MVNLKTLREQIDQIDTSIIRLIKQRMAISVKIRAFKAKTRDRTREAQVLKRLSSIAGAKVSSGFIEKLYKTIFAESRRVQSATKIRSKKRVRS